MKLEDLRFQIDALDEQLVRTMARRLVLVKQIKKAKKTEGSPVLDKKREKFILQKIKSLSLKHGVSYRILKKVFSVIFMESKALQNKK